MLDYSLVLALGLAGLTGIPEAGQQESEWDEQDLRAEADPPPGLPLARVVLLCLRDLGSVRLQVGQVRRRNLGHGLQLRGCALHRRSVRLQEREVRPRNGCDRLK